MIHVATDRRTTDTGWNAHYPTWREAVLHAEELGTDVIFGYYHFHAPKFADIVDAKPILADVQADVPNFEGWTALASWGEITTRAEIGLLVTGIGYRNPDLLADMAHTVDHISGGRVILGVGAGWYASHHDYGYDYGTVTSRMDLFDEGLLRIENRLSQLNPAPLRKIPIRSAASGEKRTLPAVARHADLWHPPADRGLPQGHRPRSRARRRIRARRQRHRAASATWKDERGAGETRRPAPSSPPTMAHADGYDFSTLKKMLKWRDEQG